MVDLCPKETSSPGYSLGFIYTQKGGSGGGGVVGCCKLLHGRVLCSFNCSQVSNHNVPISLQQDRSYSEFYKFLSFLSGKVLYFKIRALRMGHPVCFRL